jgi:hypothetical protein
MIFTPRPEGINSDMLQESSDLVDASLKDTHKPPPLRSVLTRPVLLSTANYAMLVLLQFACVSLIPLIWSTSVEFGGLGFSPVSIGSWLSVYGGIDGIFQFAIFPRVASRFGLRRVFVSSIAFCAVVVIIFPLENLVLRHRAAVGGPTVTVWPLIFLQLLSLSILTMGYSKSLLSLQEQVDAESNSPSSRCRDDLCQFCSP